MSQDRAGFVWVATYDGLVRYDGRTVKVFRNRPGDSLSLADNHITELLSAPDGTFILNMDSGTVQQFDPVTEQFTTLIHRQFMDRNKVYFNRIQLSADGKQLWGLLPGVRLVKYDIRRKTLRVFDVPALVGSANELHHFILAPSGYIYGETLAGLFEFDTRTGRKRIIPFPFKPLDREREMNFLSLNNHQVAMGPNGQIAVFGYNVIALYDPGLDRFRTVPIPQAAKAGTGKARKMATTVAYALKTVADNQLYLGYMNRLYRLDGTNQLTLIRQGDTPDSRLAPWLIDRSGVLWVSDEATGLMKLERYPLPFYFLPKRRSFGEDLLEQHLGITLPDNYEVWDNDNWPRYTTEHSGTGYLIDPSRVYRYTASGRTLTEVTRFAALDGRICCNLCLKTGSGFPGDQADTERLIWVYNNRRGLMAVSPDETKWYTYPDSRLPLRSLHPGFDAGDIQPMGQSVWIGGQHESGLFRYNLRRKRLEGPFLNEPDSINSVAGNTINCLLTDPTDSGSLWIGTDGGGLCRLDTRTMRFQRLGEAEGFPDGTIQSLETDRQGMLWCATNHGLVRVNPRNLTWRHFTAGDGLTDDRFLFASSAQLTDGRLVFGTRNGRVIFDPETIKDKPFEPPVVLTSLLINNRPADAGSSGIVPAGSGEPRFTLPAPVNALAELILDHTRNFLTISFAGLDFSKPAKINYRYQLTGVDDGWVTVGTQNTANYTQLAPGHYLFRVNSTTADGRWSSQIKELRIVITPPFWATWWAYTMYALATGCLVLGVVRFRIRQERQRQEIRLKQQEAEQLRAVNELKNRFFANITHEFRTPLTLILSPAEKLLQESRHDVVTRQAIGFIHTNASRLLRLINQLLDIAKLESGDMRIAPGQGEPVLFVEQLAGFFRPIADGKGIDFEVRTHPPAGSTAGEMWLFDADKWEKIITNVLSNAFKFTPAGGQVTLLIEQIQSANTANDQLRLTIDDTGIGIQDNHMPHIFDRFYQADDSRTRAYEGTGIGLALVKELTGLLGGTIAVKSRTGTSSGSGTRFTLTLPIQPAGNHRAAPVIERPEVLRGKAWSVVQSDSTSMAVEPVRTDTVPVLLLVDDNDELRSFMAGELARHYRVLTAADGEEALEICRHELPDIVVTDVMMPRLDGYQLTQAIKSTPATNHIAVVLLTAKAAHESRITGLEQGADDYLTKPFHTHELYLRLANLITRQQNLRAFLHRQLSSLPEAGGDVTDPFINQLHQVIESRLDDASFGVDDLAMAASMSRRTLHRKLTATTNLPAGDFIRHYRLQRAAQLLQSGLSVSETAYRVGFESPGYFTKAFKLVYQQTPSEFIGR